MTANAGTTPQSATVLTAFANGLAVTVRDAGNNPVPGVVVNFVLPYGGASAVFTGAVAATTDASGIAAVPITANAVAGGPYLAGATAPGYANVNFSLTNNPGPASAMTANAGTTPQSVAVSAVAAHAPAVTVTDASNNPISGISVTFTAPATGATGTFSNATHTITIVSDASGVASAPFTTNGTLGGPYMLTAAAAGLTPVNFSLTNVAGPPATMTAKAGTTPQSANVSTVFANGLAVTVRDAGNNPVPGVVVNFVLPYGGASATFSGPAVATTDASGIASVSITANATAGGPYLGGATLAGLPNVNFSLTNTTGAAASMAANAGTTPQSTAISTAFANPPAVAVKDAGNNPVAGVSVTFTAPGAGASGTFANATNTITVVSNASGIAAAPLTANATLGGAYTVMATAAGLSSVNFALTNTGAAASMTANAGATPQSAVISTAFSNSLAVTVKDAGNSPVAGVNVTFTAPGIGASGSFSNAANAVTIASNASGVASAPFTANAIAGGPYAVTAAAAGLATINFSLSNTTAKAAASVAVVSSANPSAAGQAVSFTATVTAASPTGSIIFKDGATPLGIVTLAGGQATLSTSGLNAGSHAITAFYGGDAGNNGATSAVLTQTVNSPADSLKLRALQVLVTPMVAQTSGQAISSAVDSAISEGFAEGGTMVAPSGNGVRFNFAADSDPQATDSVARANAPFSSVNGSPAEGSRGFGSPPSPPSRIDDSFAALAYAGPTKAAPLPVAEPRQWRVWAEVHGATLDRWGSMSTAPGAAVLYGSQINLLAGLTRKFTPDFLVGVLGGYESFDYRSEALQGRLKGDGWTVGSYLGWKVAPGIRFDSALAYSGIGYDGTAGTAAGTFNGNRWLATGGLTGTYNGFGVQIEPSARVFALWEHENAYTDTLGTSQGARDFSTGRASGGVKLSYPVFWSATTVLAPYLGLYGDYYFNRDSSGAAVAAAASIPSSLILDGWSARAVGGLTAKFGNGAQIAVGGERSGIGGNFALWTYRVRGSVPFAPQ